MVEKIALRSIASGVVNLALPPRCPVCGIVVTRDHVFCSGCWQQIDFIEPGCPRCGDPFVASRENGLECGVCLADPPPFETARAAVAYGDIARAIALRLKYGGRIGLAKLMAQMMRRSCAGTEGALIVPVPLHRRRLWRRGFNQAALIARILAQDNGAVFTNDVLKRTRPTPLLRGLSRKERAKTVRGAFTVPSQKREFLSGKRVLLVDDVYTTGSTVRACAAALRRAGASEIHVRTWARVSRDEAPAY